MVSNAADNRHECDQITALSMARQIRRHGAGCTAVISLRRACLALLLIATSSCERHWQEQHDYGAVRVIEHWKNHPFRWEGSGMTSITRTQVCSTRTGQCQTTSSVLVDRPPDGRGRWIRLMGNEDFDQFMDTYTGERVECLNCAPESSVDFLRQLFRTSWSTDGQRAVGFFGDRHAATPLARLHVVVVEFSPAGFRLSRLTSTGAEADARMAPVMVPEGSVVAWMDCTDNCTLYWQRLSDNRRWQRHLGCPYHDYLQIAWEQSVPRAQYDWGAATGDITATLCRDAQGQVALPIASPPAP